VPAADYGDTMPELRWSQAAIDTLQELCETFVVNQLTYAALVMYFKKQVTVKQKDMQLVQDLKVL